MLARVLELWDTQPDAPARIGGTRPDVREPEHRRGRVGRRGWEGR